jgi:actin related protein 2/3 complex subunit 5
VVERVLGEIADGEISAVIEGLDLEGCDTLMKYVFRFMAKAANKAEDDKKSVNCTLMLKLHAQLVEKAGVGCIVRALTDRKTV